MPALQVPGPRSRPARVLRALPAAIFLLSLAACSPEHDWREQRANEGGWRAMLPAKPSALTRPIRLGDMPVDMAMKGARVNETAFTVAQADLPDPSPATGARAVAAMRQALVRNISGTETSAKPVPVPLVDGNGRKVAEVPGLALEATGTIGQRPARLSARLVAHQGRALQALAVGTDLPPEQAKIFLDSFALENRAAAGGTPDR